jgi:hypothetical protein
LCASNASGSLPHTRDDNVVNIIEGNVMSPSQPVYPTRSEARLTRADKYAPETPCPKHPHAPFYRVIDRCVTCTNSEDRAAPARERRLRGFPS